MARFVLASLACAVTACSLANLDGFSDGSDLLEASGRSAEPSKDTTTDGGMASIAPDGDDEKSDDVDTEPAPTDGGGGGDDDAGGPPPDGIDAGGTPPPREGWQFRKKVTVDATRIFGSADLADFPLLVSLTDADLKTTANGGKVESGKDIAFFAADGVTQLAHEAEVYTASTGRLLAWVKVPVLSVTSGAKLYLAFGDAAVTKSLENRNAVWSNSFSGVWHMGDDTWTDSATTKKGTPVGAPSTTNSGKFGSAGTFGSSDVYVDVGSDASLRPSSITLSTWAKPSSVGSAPDRHPYMVHQDTYRETNPRGYYMEIFRTQSDPRPTFYTANATNRAHAFALTKVVNDVWYYVVGTRDAGSGYTRIYVNGVEEGNATMTGGIAYDANPVRVGGVGAESWDGALDEVRIARVARSAGWIRTEYENQRAPGSFVVVGALETSW